MHFITYLAHAIMQTSHTNSKHQYWCKNKIYNAITYLQHRKFCLIYYPKCVHVGSGDGIQKIDIYTRKLCLLSPPLGTYWPSGSSHWCHSPGRAWLQAVQAPTTHTWHYPEVLGRLSIEGDPEGPTGFNLMQCRGKGLLWREFPTIRRRATQESCWI